MCVACVWTLSEKKGDKKKPKSWAGFRPRLLFAGLFSNDIASFTKPLHRHHLLRNVERQEGAFPGTLIVSGAQGGAI